METVSVPEVFGSLVFNDKVMKERLPKDIYKAVVETSKSGKHLELDIANVVAAAMKEWAIEHGATHFTHWFQPLTGLTAEKHDSFITPTDDGGVIMEFSGRELIKGEPDASSFPSGGLRATFEARGYTAWDPSSPAFVKDGSLYIPTAFCSYGGEALDKKTPLLRSIEAVGESAVKVLHLLGRTDVKYVHTTVGSEQEYFLIDKDMYLKRKDLLMCGRTLIGAPAPKGQEMEDHYFGVLKPKVADFMHDLDNELWKLGVPAKTKHNEVAPSQHELAPVFEAGNVAVDHNQLTMEVMKKVADRKGYACLLHEKPFKGVNGSGKHDNWSLVTDGGENLLNPGKTHEENFQFMVFLMAIIEAVDDYQDLLRISVATAGNDHRLGANEAPPAIISIFVGDELLGLLDGVKGGKLPEFKKKALMELGTKVLPEFKKDKTDRNRTSPFAFTGNKFEFRMPGSALSVADPNIILNTAVSEALDGIYNALKEVPSDKIEEETMKLLKDMLDKHSRILFDGNGYADEWIEEAHKRGLLDLRSLPDAMPYMLQKKNLELFAKHHILTEEEVKSRYEIYLDNYSKTIHIESLTMQEMVRKDFTEGLVAYLKAVTDETAKKRAIIPDLKCAYEDHIIRVLDESEEKIGELLIKLSEDTCKAEQESDEFKKACMYHEVILNDMEELRKYVDEAEAYIPEDFLPYPTYGELLFSLR